MTHALKTEPPYFQQVVDGLKNFEMRKDDRPFKEGDKLLLQEFKDGEYTGKEYELIITNILRDAPHFGLRKDFCVLSFKQYVRE